MQRKLLHFIILLLLSTIRAEAQAPSVVTNPSNAIICTGSNANFSVTANNATAYQWQLSVNSGVSWSNLTNTLPYTNVTTSVMNVNNATVGLSGNQYRCVVIGASLPNAISLAGTLTVNAPPAITVQPPVQTSVCTGVGTSISFTAANATGFQWYGDFGAGFVALSNNATYTGVTTNTLNISSANAFTIGTYRCFASNNCGPTATNTSVLNVYANTVITSNPSTTTNCTGGFTYFSVTATGSGLTYQWQVSTNGGGTWANLTNTAPYSAVTSNQLTISNTPFSLNTNQYRCFIVGACLSSATSTAATLNLNTPPTVTLQPSNATTCFSGSTSFTVAATGTLISYQWQISTNAGTTWTNIITGGNHANVTNPTLNIFGAVVSMNNYQYRCAVTGICPTSPALTTPAVLTVTPPVYVTTQPPVSQSVCVGTTTSISFTHVGGSTLQWYADYGAGFVALVNNANYSGVTTNTLNIISAVTTVATYRCIFSNNCSGPIATNTSILNVYPPTAITAQPVSTAKCAGSNSYFSVIATGASLAYQWQISTNGGITYANLTNNTPYGGVNTNQLTIFGTPTGINTNRFRCAVSGLCLPAVNSGGAILTVTTPPAVTTQPVNTSTCLGGNATISIAATGSALTYQWRVNTGSGFVNVTNIGVYSGANTANLNITSAPQTMNGYQYYCMVSGSCAIPVNTNTVLLGINPKATITSQPPTITNVCEGDYTTISFNHNAGTTFQWYVDFGTGFVPLVNNANYNNVNTASLSITNAIAAQTGSYRCMVGNPCTTPIATNTVALNVYPPTTINAQPKDVTVCQGNNANFSITTSGLFLTYQWQVSTDGGNVWANLANTLPYLGVTSSTLSISNVPSSLNNNLYRCAVGGQCGIPVISNSTLLTAKPLPAIFKFPRDTSVQQYTNAAFHVQGTDFVGYKYYWQVSKDGVNYTDIHNGSEYTGAQTKDLIVNKPFYAMNGFKYRCLINSDIPCYPRNADTTAGAKLTITGWATTVGNTANNSMNITIYPNPVSGNEIMVKADNPSAENMHFRIVDQFGRTLQSGDVKLSQFNSSVINVAMLVPGVYMIQFSGDEHETVQAIRFTKQQ